MLPWELAWAPSVLNSNGAEFNLTVCGAFPYNVTRQAGDFGLLGTRAAPCHFKTKSVPAVPGDRVTWRS